MLTVRATDGGTPVAGANVEIRGCGATGTTNADGKWTGRVRAGKQKVIVWTDAGGTLRGGIEDITMPRGTHSVDVALVDAIFFHLYWPLAVGNTWQYEYRHSGDDGSWRKTWVESVNRAVTVAGEPAVVIRGEWSGGPVEWEETRAANADGFFMYDQQHGTDTIKFDPRMRVGDLLPMGYQWHVESLGVHSDGSPDTPTTMKVKFSRFQRVRVPAGMYPDAARVDVEMTMGPETNQITVWFAQNVGIVREVEKNAVRTNEKRLEEYSLRGVRPLRPIGPMRPILRRMP